MGTKITESEPMCQVCQVCQARGFEFFTMVFGSEKFHSGFEFFATYYRQTAVYEFYNRINNFF